MIRTISYQTDLISAPTNLLEVETSFVSYKERVLQLLGRQKGLCELAQGEFPTLGREFQDYTFQIEDKILEPTQLCRYVGCVIHNLQKIGILPTNWHRTEHCAQQKYRL